MTDGYKAFLIKLSDIYPETYLKIVEFPDHIIVGWINEISQVKEMITLQNPEQVKNYFDMKVRVSSIILNSSIIR